VFQKFEKNMDGKYIRGGTTFLKETYSDSKWILN
jgi:hypothetical protein